MCDVPRMAVFCSESIECFPGTASKFFLKLLVTIPMAPIITGIIVHFRFHIRCIFCIIIIIIIIYRAAVSQSLRNTAIHKLRPHANGTRPVPFLIFRWKKPRAANLCLECLAEIWMETGGWRGEQTLDRRIPVFVTLTAARQTDDLATAFLHGK